MLSLRTRTHSHTYSPWLEGFWVLLFLSLSYPFNLEVEASVNVSFTIVIDKVVF